MKEKIIKETEENYRNWLIMSKLTEKQFLQYHYIGNFEIRSEIVEGFNQVSIGRIYNGTFKNIGCPFLYELGNLEAFQDLILLLMLLARKLDAENDKSPQFQLRKDYFYTTIKRFLIGREEYRQLKNN